MPISVGKKTLNFSFEEVFVYEGAKFCITVFDKQQQPVTEFVMSKTKSRLFNGEGRGEGQ